MIFRMFDRDGNGFLDFGGVGHLPDAARKHDKAQPAWSFGRRLRGV